MVAPLAAKYCSGLWLKSWFRATDAAKYTQEEHQSARLDTFNIQVFQGEKISFFYYSLCCRKEQEK